MAESQDFFGRIRELTGAKRALLATISRMTGLNLNGKFNKRHSRNRLRK